MALTIISLMKQVPLPSEMRMGEDGLMDRTKAKSIINVDCSFALEAGLQLKNENPDAKLIVCSMGPPSFEASLKKAISMGYDEAYLLSDRRLGGSDTYATGLAIATMLKHLGFNKDAKEPFMIVAGRQTSDGDTAHVPSQVAENMEIPQATFIETAEFKEGNIVAKRIIEGGYQMMQLPLPCMLSLTPTGIPPRRPTLKGAIKARESQITIFNIDDVGLTNEKIGLSGSPTIVAKVQNIVSERAPVMMSRGDKERELVENLIANLKSGKNALETVTKKEKKGRKRPDYEVTDFRDGAKGILTWAEVAGKKLTRPSLELLTPARELAEKLGNDTKVTTLLIGHKVKDLAQTLIAHGSDTVIVVEDKRLKEYRVLPFASTFEQVIKKINPEIALFSASTAGRELAPRIGVKTHGGVTADCTALDIGEHIDRKKKTIFSPILESKRPTYGESKLATILGFVCPQISTARAGTFEVPTPNEKREGVVKTFKPTLKDKDFTVEIVETVRGKSGLQNLFEADIIVAGGRPAGEVDGLNLIQELTQALKDQGINAEWAASRPAVDSGYAEYARQIGQTGKTVRPKVYISAAISGAIQHIAGMKESDTIVSIDSNPKASIFQNADFGIVGTYQDVIPELIEQVKGGFTFGIKQK
ncbi:MAG: FAD-binding protein [Epsilonproteobacteria bacterium]|nr:FAD-binding protein [Campylobacterota bacterium]